MDSNLRNIIDTIHRIKVTNQFRKYIDFIRFPFYRNIEIDTQINFDFPLTVFIGQNGCGKSSCLHALYGAPDGYTPYKFWFDTKVDPVSYYNDQRKRHSFWYSFKDSDNQIKEVLKARIRRENDPNYWETSRPLAWAGMTTRENRNERDSPISKNVVYLDFRAELSAFDKYYYFGNLTKTRARNKQEFIRRKSSSLNNLFSGKKASIYSSSRLMNAPVQSFSQDELLWISFILGRKYTEGISVEHRLFRNKGYSVLFKTDFATYSEAVAGSGEIAVVRLVKEVLRAEDSSLILLDEPEVSLHPGAQNRLRIFLLEQIKRKKHQVILATHSPSIVKGLPKEAVKVFYQNPSNGRFLVKEHLTPEEAFYHIEYPVENRKNILVEDVLAKNIILGVLEEIGEETKNLFNVSFNPGGESVIKKEFISVFCRETNMNDYVFFDGDQKPSYPHYNWKEFTVSDLNADFLKTKIKEQTGMNVNFSVDGGPLGDEKEQQIELLKKYLDFYLSNVFYLPKDLPENIIWHEEFARSQIEDIMFDKEQKSEIVALLSSISDTKEKFAFMSETILGDSSSESISSIHKLYIRRWLNLKNADFDEIKLALNQIISRV